MEILDAEEALENIDQIVSAVSSLDSLIGVPDDVYRDISPATRIVENSTLASARTPRANNTMQGRPSFDITQDQLQSLIVLRFTVPQISNLLQVLTRTIERCLAEYMSARSFNTIEDKALDNKVMAIKSFHPNCGSKNLVGYLASRKIRVPRQRLRQSLQRVDPVGVAECVFIPYLDH